MLLDFLVSANFCLEKYYGRFFPLRQAWKTQAIRNVQMAGFPTNQMGISGFRQETLTEPQILNHI
jgi:hypothetical protein